MTVLFSDVRVNSYCHIEDTVVLPNVTIGRDCRIRKAVIDQGCVIPKATVIGEDPVADAKRFHVTEGGVTLVVPEMLGQELYHVR